MRGLTQADSATAVYLGFLRTWPDTHIARKFGSEVAEAVKRDAQTRALPDSGPARRTVLMEWDAKLKANRINPGACADLTVATLFAAFLTDRASNGLRLFSKSG